ncbi:hypothetical protein [Pseudokineococcus lusitanus]|uniref:hypothetical protein n=1 Tax=Pseudokineococcus lusitanus TaxID=763993 RepID=UPI0011CD79F4|nr:hypothetical protein [Pseudokineococcus lusitanus]
MSSPEPAPPPPPVRLVQPRGVRVALVVFAVVWAAFVGVGLLLPGLAGDPLRLVAGVLLLLAGWFVSWRQATTSVVSDGDDLVVRGDWRTVRLPRAALADVRAEGGPRPARSTAARELVAVLRDGSRVVLAVTGVMGVAVVAPEQREADLAAVRRWAGLP